MASVHEDLKDLVPFGNMAFRPKPVRHITATRSYVRAVPQG